MKTEIIWPSGKPLYAGQLEPYSTIEFEVATGKIISIKPDPCATGICLRTGERIDDWSNVAVGAKGRCGGCPGLKP